MTTVDIVLAAAVLGLSIVIGCTFIGYGLHSIGEAIRRANITVKSTSTETVTHVNERESWETDD